MYYTFILYNKSFTSKHHQVEYHVQQSNYCHNLRNDEI